MSDHACTCSTDRAAGAAGGAALTAGQAPAPLSRRRSRRPQQPPTFKVQVDYVEVDAVVTDAQGNFVRDLKKEDFQVFEDGKPQTITDFTLVDIPVERAERPLFAAAADRARRADQRAAVRRPRLRDGARRSAHALRLRSQRVKNAARQFIERKLGANDLMAVVHTGGPSDANQEFTSNKRLLLAAVDKFDGPQAATRRRSTRPTSTTAPRDMRQQGDRAERSRRQERGFNARTTLDTLRNVAEWFGVVRGRRKAMLFVSEGIDYDINDMIPTNGSNHRARR